MNWFSAKKAAASAIQRLIWDLFIPFFLSTVLLNKVNPQALNANRKKTLDRKGAFFDNSTMQNRRPAIVAIVLPIIVGSSGLIHLMSRPRFESIRSVDVVQLLGSGLCFGVALTAIFAMILSRRGD